MARTKILSGHMVQGDKPHWQPLLNLLAGDFMWMFEVELEDGRRVHAYKHCWTRRYLHLDDEDGAWAYTRDGRYQAVDPSRLLHAALEGSTNHGPRSVGPDEAA
jgi:hypothetical protein